jgi:ornithine decarboxylase
VAAPIDFPLDLAQQQQQQQQQQLPAPVPGLWTLLAAHGVPVIDECVDAQMFRQQISEKGLDAPFYIADLGAVEKRFRLWQKLLPRVEPRYAVKCNPDEILLGTLQALGCGFDAASEEEMRFAFKAGADVDKIVFANPVKGRSCIEYARKHGVGLTTFDSAAELEKLAEHWPDAQLLLRISTDDSGASCQLSNKYGAQLGEEVHSLILLARTLQLEIVGVAFHCGSGQTQSVAFGRSIVDAAAVFDQLRLFGFSPHILDIGGGFPGEDAISAHGVATFDEIAGSISSALSVHFPEHDIDGSGNLQPLRVIAEPGRFFAHSAFTLACNIIGKKHIQRPADAASAPEHIACSYTIGDGIYGSFNNLLYDHAVATPVPLKLSDNYLQRSTPVVTAAMAAAAAAVPRPADWVSSTVFGPTCDGLDCVCKQALLPPDLSPGRDWLLFEGMGAYTLAAGSTFNGIQRATVIYVYTSNGTAARDDADSYVKAAQEESAWAIQPQAVMVATSSTTTRANALPLSRSRL